MAKSRQSMNKAELAASVPDAELDVLACLWQGDMTAAEIRERLMPYRPMAHGSVLTLLTRLGGKGLVTRSKSGRGKAFTFRAVTKAEPTYRKILSELVKRVFAGSRTAVVASLLDTGTPTVQELQEMRRLLDQHQASAKRES